MKYPKSFDTRIEGHLKWLKDARRIQLERMERLEENPTDSERTKYEIKKNNIEKREEKVRQLRSSTQLAMSFNPIEEQYNEVSKEFEQATEEEWAKVPNSKFKTFQNIFAPPGYKIIPREGGIYDGMDYDSIPLDVCIIDPEFVTDWFVKEFGLADLSGCTDRIQKLFAKSEAKSKIVDFFNHLKPMSPYGPDDEKGSLRLLVLADFDDEHDGKIIMPGYRRSNDINRKIIQRSANIYRAQRRVGHVEDNYENEKPKIFAVQTKLKSIIKRAVGLKERDPDVVVICQEIEEEIEDNKDIKNIHKQDIYRIMRKVKDLRDSLGKHNPGASCMQLLSALKNITKRLTEILGISGTMDIDREIINMRINSGENALEHGPKESGRIIQRLDGMEEDSISDKEVEKIKRHLSSLGDIEELEIMPFNLYAAKIIKSKKAIEVALEAGDIDVIRKESEKAIVISKIFSIQKELEKILFQVSAMPEETRVQFLLDKIDYLYEFTAKKETAKSFRNGYTCFHAHIEMLIEKIGDELTDKEKEDEYESLKARYKEINFPEILEELD